MNTLYLYLISFFRIGYLKKAPGTFASFAAMLIIIFIPAHLKYYIFIPLIVSFFLLSLRPIRKIESEYGKDPSFIVIDEVIAMWLVYLDPFINFDILYFIAGFIFFRIFDIFKPFPLNIINNRKGAFYVLADDLLAAIYSIIFLHILSFFFNIMGSAILPKKIFEMNLF